MSDVFLFFLVIKMFIHDNFNMRHNYPAMLSTEDNSVMYKGNFVCMSDVFRVLLIIKLLI